MTLYSKYIRKKATVERLRIVCPSEQRNAIIDALYEDGFRVKSQGPFPMGDMICDVSRQLLIAEKETS